MKLHIRLATTPTANILIQMNSPTKDLELHVDTQTEMSAEVILNNPEQAKLIELEVLMRPA